MFHALDPQQPAHVFRHLPLLQFVEASIYLLDERNERALSGRLASTAAPAAAPAAATSAATLLPKGTHAPSPFWLPLVAHAFALAKSKRVTPTEVPNRLDDLRTAFKRCKLSEYIAECLSDPSCPPECFSFPR